MLSQIKTQEDTVCDAILEIEKTLFYLGANEFTGTFKLELNFHKGSISRKIKHGTIETITLPKE